MKDNQLHNTELQEKAVETFDLKKTKELLDKLKNNKSLSKKDFENIDKQDNNLSETEKKLYEKLGDTKSIISFLEGVINILEKKDSILSTSGKSIGLKQWGETSLGIQAASQKGLGNISEYELLNDNSSQIIKKYFISKKRKALLKSYDKKEYKQEMNEYTKKKEKEKVELNKILEKYSNNIDNLIITNTSEAKEDMKKLLSLNIISNSNCLGLIDIIKGNKYYENIKKKILDKLNLDIAKKLKGFKFENGTNLDIAKIFEETNCNVDELIKKLNKLKGPNGEKLTKEKINDIVFGVASIKEDKTKSELREILPGLGLNIKDFEGKNQEQIIELLTNKGVDKKEINIILEKLENLEKSKKAQKIDIKEIEKKINQNNKIIEIYNNFLDKYYKLINSKNITETKRKNIETQYNEISSLYDKIESGDEYSKDKLIIQIYKFNKNFGNINNNYKQKIDNIIEKIKTKNINKMNKQELILALEYTNSYYNINKENFHFDFIEEDSISELKDQTDYNNFQERLLKKLGLETGYNNNYIVGYNNEKGNYIIKIHDFKEKIQLKNIKNLNSKEIHNYLKNFSIENSNLKGEDFLNKLKKEIGISGYNKILTYIYENQETTDLKGIFTQKEININNFKASLLNDKIKDIEEINNNIKLNINNNINYYIKHIDRIGEINNTKLIKEIINQYKGIINFSNLSNNLINNKDIINLIIKNNTSYFSGTISLKEIDKKYYINQKELLLFDYNSLDIKTIKNILDNTDIEGQKTILISDTIEKSKKEELLKQYPEIKKLLNISANDEIFNKELSKLYNNEKNINYNLIDIYLSKQPNDIIFGIIIEKLKTNNNLLYKLPIIRNKLLKNNEIAVKLININQDYFYMQNKKDKSNIIRLKAILENIIKENKKNKEKVLGDILSSINLDIYKNMEIFGILNKKLNKEQLKKIFFYPKMQAKFKSLVKNITKNKNIILTPDMNKFINKILSLAKTYTKEYDSFKKTINTKINNIKNNIGNDEILNTLWRNKNLINKITTINPKKGAALVGFINSSFDSSFGNKEYYINELFRLYKNKEELNKDLNDINKEINKEKINYIKKINPNKLSKNTKIFLASKGIIDSAVNTSILSINQKKLEKYFSKQITILGEKYKKYNIDIKNENLNKIVSYEILNGKELSNINSKKELILLLEKTKNYKNNKNNQELSNELKYISVSLTTSNTQKTISKMSNEDFNKAHNGDTKFFWEKVKNNYIKNTEQHLNELEQQKKENKTDKKENKENNQDQENINYDNYTIEQSSDNNYTINVNGEKIDGLTKDEIETLGVKKDRKGEIIIENKEALKNLVNMKETLESIGIDFAWKYRNELINIMKSSKGFMGMQMDLNDKNLINHTELNNYLRFILTIIGENPDTTLMGNKQKIRQLNNYSQTNKNKNTMKGGLSKVGEKFIDMGFLTTNGTLQTNWSANLNYHISNRKNKTQKNPT